MSSVDEFISGDESDTDPNYVSFSKTMTTSIIHPSYEGEEAWYLCTGSGHSAWKPHMQKSISRLRLW